MLSQQEVSLTAKEPFARDCRKHSVLGSRRLPASVFPRLRQRFRNAIADPRDAENRQLSLRARRSRVPTAAPSNRSRTKRSVEVSGSTAGPTFVSSARTISTPFPTESPRRYSSYIADPNNPQSVSLQLRLLY